jgi:LysM repeat protein
MNLFKRMQIVAPAVVLMSACVGAFALPTKKVNGKSCYYYKVGKSETVYGVANKLGVSRDDIIKYNPAATDGVKEGQVLYFPVGEFKALSDSSADTADATVTHIVQKGETLYGISHFYGVSAEDIIALNPSAKNGVKTGSRLIISKGTAESKTDEPIQGPEIDNRLTPVDKGTPVLISQSMAEDADTDSVDVAESAAITEPQKYTIAVMLPFMLDDEKMTKATNQVTDFYKGFLIAADSLSNANQQVEILTYDTKGSLDHVNNILNTNARLKEASLIIAPSSQDQLQAIANFGNTNNVYVLNNFVVKDTSYQNNAYVLQTNTTTDRLYEQAINTFVEAISNDPTTIPVILNSTTGKQDKQSFVDQLTRKLSAKGITALTIQYSGNLSLSTITDQIGEPLPNQHYAVISTSGALNDFHKYAPGVLKFKESMNNNGGDVRLFGYPEWTTFRSDALEMLHKIDSTIYSRFYADQSSPEMSGIDSAFKRWYGKSPADGVPSQAALGFDTGCYVFNALSHNNGDFSNNANCSWQGAQITFNFKHEGNSTGLVNESVYIVRFRPGTYVETLVL